MARFVKLKYNLSKIFLYKSKNRRIHWREINLYFRGKNKKIHWRHVNILGVFTRDSFIHFVLQIYTYKLI